MKREVKAVLPVLQYPAPELLVPSVPVSEATDEVRQLAHSMLETLYCERGIGLAAPQVGHNIRLIVVDVSSDCREPYLLLNPRFLKKRGSQSSVEGCLSLPNIWLSVSRATQVEVEAEGLDGKTVHFWAEGLLAICLQHEVDHLDGITLLEGVSVLKRTLALKKMRKLQGVKR